MRNPKYKQWNPEPTRTLRSISPEGAYLLDGSIGIIGIEIIAADSGVFYDNILLTNTEREGELALKKHL